MTFILVTSRNYPMQIRIATYTSRYTPKFQKHQE
jgi:hypothetical protein